MKDQITTFTSTEYLERDLPIPEGRAVPTAEELRQGFNELQKKVLAGRASALERTRYERCLEIFAKSEGAIPGPSGAPIACSLKNRQRFR